MLPRNLYEALPYLWIMLAALILANFTAPLATGSGLLLFLAGSGIWVLRSNHRRRDRFKAQHNPAALARRRRILPAYLYEALPFAYLACGWFIVMAIPSPTSNLFGALLLVAGSWIWRKRHLHRMKPATAVAYQRR